MLQRTRVVRNGVSVIGVDTDGVLTTEADGLVRVLGLLTVARRWRFITAVGPVPLKINKSMKTVVVIGEVAVTGEAMVFADLGAVTTD